MPDALTLLETRRSVSARNMVGPGPSPAEVDRLIAIASRVPDHGKLAPWRFIVIEGAARAAVGAKLATILTARGADGERIEAARTAFLRAPVIVGVISTAAEHPKIPVWEQWMSAGASAMALCVGAHAMGYVANWLTDWFAFDEDGKAATGVAPAERVAGWIHLGSQAEPPQERPRPELATILTRLQA